MTWRPDEWAPLVLDSCVGQGGRRGDGRLVGRTWAKRRNGPVLRLSAQDGTRRFSYFLSLITR
jgi:hypothetical protein